MTLQTTYCSTTPADATVTGCVISNAIHNQCLWGLAPEHSIAALMLLDVTGCSSRTAVTSVCT